MVARGQPGYRQLPLVLLRFLCLLPTGLPARSVEFTRGTDNITVRQGDTAILRCFIDDRQSRVAWLNRSNIIFAGQDKWSLDPRVELERRSPLEYSLRIQKVDVFDEGTYTCSVQTQQHPKTSQHHLIVQATELEGDEEYLEIFGITREQSGKYECRAANEVAVADMKQVLVTVNYPPTITEWRGTETAVGRPGSLRCEALGVPTPEFEWYRDDERINSAQGIEIYNHGTTSILTVVNVTENHYGNYTCLATNKLGAMNASLYLYRPGTVRMEEGRSPTLSQSLWFLAASLTCLLFTC
ncbi:limbic system-associated membrane protein isoform X3 [Latimeria chalumnae]|uniref:limbic system-associated membrane protein isoform X3 n=1 Tax=Latimeria chalumnae TaxID=7897 RepID=UPI00313C5474